MPRHWLCFQESAHMLRISDIEFTNSGLKTGYAKYFALSFIFGSELALTFFLSVSNSKFGGLLIRDVDGNVTLDACRVVNATSNDPRYGGGNYVHYKSLDVHTTLTACIKLCIYEQWTASDTPF